MLEAWKRLLRALGLGGTVNGDAPVHGEAEGGDATPGVGAAAEGATEGCDDGASVEMLSCPEVLDRLFEYLDGELEGATAGQVRAHLEKCRRCYPRLKFEKSFMEALSRARAGEEPPRDLRSRVVDLLREEGLELG